MKTAKHIRQEEMITKWSDIFYHDHDLDYYAEKLNITLGHDHHAVLQQILQGANIFLSGAAGTGKSTVLKFLQMFLEEQNKNIVTLAPTGVAALNVGGQTIHSFFKFKTSILQEHNIRKRRKNEGFKNIDLLVIDEVSMVRADLFQAIDWFLRKNGPSEDLPFGGIQILLIGDLYQLPPIISRQERGFFYTLYESPFFFQTMAYKAAEFHKITLQKVHRQDDPFFIDMLNRIRVGHIDQHVLSDLNTRHVQYFSSEEIEKLQPMILTGRNDTAENINQRELSKINNEEYHYEGHTDGDFTLSEQRMPAPRDLYLRVGARVMFTKNDGMQRWVNGTIGTVAMLEDDFIYVRLENFTVCVTAEKWEAITYDYDEEKQIWTSKVCGTYTQFPLTLAWAVTIHKSQGQTLESCLIQLDGGAFAEGQVYVALSRCKSFETVFLSEEIKSRDIRVNAHVRNINL